MTPLSSGKPEGVAIPCPECHGIGYHEPRLYSDHRETCDWCAGAGTVETTACCDYCRQPVSGTWCTQCEESVTPLALQLSEMADAWLRRLAAINAQADALRARMEANSARWFELHRTSVDGLGSLVEAA